MQTNYRKQAYFGKREKSKHMVILAQDNQACSGGSGTQAS